jgi:hypothetical protein
VVESEIDSRTDRFSITKTWLIIWTMVTGITILACYILRPYVSYYDEFAVLVNATNVISYALTIGLPVFLASSITFGTPNARKHIVALRDSGKSPIKVFFRCVSETYILVVAFSIAISLALFLEPQLSGILFYAPTGTGYLIYFPPVLIATTVVSLLLATIGVFLVVVTDNIIASTSIGCIITISLATAVGWSPQALRYSLTHGLALLSPSNIMRILAGHLTNYESPYYPTLAQYFGFDASFLTILFSLIVLGVIAFICAITSIRVLVRTTSFWVDLQNTDSTIWESESERHRKHLNKRGLKIRRLLLVGFVIALLSGLTFGMMFYRNIVIEEGTIIFHQSPEEGEQINLGEWYVFSCNIQPTDYGQWTNLRYQCSIENWDSAPENLSFYYSVLNMTSSEFLSLNETHRRDHCRNTNRTKGNFGGFIGGWELEQGYEFFILVLKVIATENATLSGFIHCSINIRQSPL